MIEVVGTSRFARAVFPLMRSSLAAVLILGTVAASCTGTQTEEGSPSSSSVTGAVTPSPETTPSAQSVADYSSFTQALEDAGFSVRHGGMTRLPAGLLAVPGQQVLIDGVPTSVFEYRPRRHSIRCVPPSGRVVTRSRRRMAGSRSSTGIHRTSTARASCSSCASATTSARSMRSTRCSDHSSRVAGCSRWCTAPNVRGLALRSLLSVAMTARTGGGPKGGAFRTTRTTPG
jgi:hypothetical protein